jgi:outer membrane autotransporter protein
MRRAKLARHVRPQRAATPPQLRCTDRRSLLAGTALASTLLLGGVLAPSPAAAADCIDGKTTTNPVIVTNNVKITTPGVGIPVNIPNQTLNYAYACNLALVNATPVAGDYTQDANVVLNLTLDNSIDIVNSGDIDPAIGILALIDNDAITSINTATITLTNTGDISGDLTQSATIGQANTIASDIAIDNSGGIVADYAGILADIDNTYINLANYASATLMTTSVIGGAVTQSVDIDQANAIASDIAIVNSGDIDAGYAGIRAEIDNDLISLASSTDTILTRGGTSGEANQSTNIGQANTIASSGIAIENRGGIVAGYAGISTEIGNAYMTLANEASAIVTVASGVNGSTTQSADIDQANTVTSGISIVNSGGIAAGYVGIGAEIGNTNITLTNDTIASILAYGSLFSGDVAQSADVGQANTIASDVAIDNSGATDAGYTGIGSEIGNTYISLTNVATASVTGRPDGTYDLTQPANIDQANAIASDIAIVNSGDIDPTIGIGATIVNRYTYLANRGAATVVNGSPVDLAESADIDQTNTIASGIGIENRGGIVAGYVGIGAEIGNRDIVSVNYADTGIVNGQATYTVIYGDATLSTPIAQTNRVANDITIDNSASVAAGYAGILAAIDNETINFTTAADVALTNNDEIVGDLSQSANIDQANTVASDIAIVNSGDVKAGALGIQAEINNATINFAAAAAVANRNNVDVSGDLSQSANVDQTNTIASSIAIENRGNVESDGVGISALIDNRDIVFSNYTYANVGNAGSVGGSATQTLNVSQTNRIESFITIVNSGNARAVALGIYAGVPDPVYVASNLITYTLDAPTQTVNVTEDTVVDTSILIVNTGLITADSLFAIDTFGATTTIINRSGGVITGLVDLTDKSDLFDNQAGGVFEARLTSEFRGGDDLFKNEGIVHTAADLNAAETTAFVGLERFESQGLITMQDGREGDSFEISNTLGGTDLEFIGSGKSTLAVDAFLGPPGSTSDTFTINGDVSGKTVIQVNNTNPGPGAPNTVGIPVVFVSGKVKGDEFFLPQPIDAGVVSYDLFFRPTGSGVFELRSFLGPGVSVPPQLITAVQDIWFRGSDTWLDRTADLRVLLNRHAAPIAYDPGAKYAEGSPQRGASFTPAIWVRGSGEWLSREDTETTRAFGRTFEFNVNRDLEVMDFQMGLDLGERGLLSEDDILVFGPLGGFVHADLDYEAIDRAFDFEGGQVGGYATYLRGGLFVDTLLNVQLMEIQTKSFGFPNSLDATTVGLRTDSGYRFGSFSGGTFIEPLATIAVAWADIDGFSLGGDKVSFDDDANVRGRLGLRVGTSREVWTGIVMEPFVVGSVWGNLSGDNKATLTSTGTTFHFTDDPDDVWGVLSTGVNFFNPSASTAVFAKLDVTFGEDVEGISARGGMRVNW